MSVSVFQGQLLEVTAVGCNKLKETRWNSSQDPCVCLEYGSTKYRTRTCTDGVKKPTFQQKFVFTLIEGLWEFNVGVWNSITVTSYGSGNNAGEIQLILRYANANANEPTKIHTPFTPSSPPYSGAPAPQVPVYSSTPSFASNFPPTSYSAAPPPPYSSYPPHSSGYHPPAYNHQPAAYPLTYPPPPSLDPTVYPPPSQDTHYYPPG